MRHSTYSFSDIEFRIFHALTGFKDFNGTGLGHISVEQAAENTTVTRSADGSSMMSKVTGSNGIITIRAQQSSKLDAELWQTHSLLKVASPEVWATLQMWVRDTINKKEIIINAAAFSKPPIQTFEKEATYWVWEFYAQYINTIVLP